MLRYLCGLNAQVKLMMCLRAAFSRDNPVAMDLDDKEELPPHMAPLDRAEEEEEFEEVLFES